MPNRPLHARPSIHGLLLLLVLACVLPASLAIGIALVHSYQVQHAALVERTLATARALSRRVDLELSSTTAGLHTLATSPSLEAGNLASFEAQARRALRHQSGDALMLLDSRGVQLLNTMVAPQHLPLAPPAAMPAVLSSTARPGVSDLFLCGTAGRPMVAVGVPVEVSRRAGYSLAMGLFPERLQDVLATRPVAAEWVVSVFDSKGTIIARTHAAQALVGQEAVTPLQRAMLERREGTVQAVLRDGRPVLAAFSRATLADWSVMIGIPQRELLGGLQRSLGVLAAVTTLLLAFGVLMARWLSRRIEQSMRSLVAPAAALGRGEPVHVEPLPLREAEQVADALRRASAVLAARTVERDQATHAHTVLQHEAAGLAQAAHFDALTGLMNRTSLYALLQRHVHDCGCGDDGAMAVLFVDLDDFKAVNDGHGHAVGDELLRAFAQRLRDAVGDAGEAARLGGDEFTVVLAAVRGDALQAIAREVTERLAQPYEIGAVRLHVSASVGGVRCPGAGATVQWLLEAADAAMYRAKSGGKRGFVVSGAPPL